MSDPKDSAVNVLNIMSELFPPPPYNCIGRRDNPDLVALCEPVYQEDYTQLVSKNGTKLAAYQREIGEYDEYEVETLSYGEWRLLLHRPVMRITYLKAQILRGLNAETAAGIKHYSSQSDWVQASFQKIPVPELKCEIPELNDGLCNPKTCEKHYHCIYCGSTKVTHETFSDWYRCRSCHKHYEESDIEAYQND